MEFQVLGSTEAVVGDHRVHVGRRRERLLLGILVLELNHVVPEARLIELMWPDGGPKVPRRALQVCFARLKRALRAVENTIGLSRVHAGYMLSCDPALVDLHRFKAIVTDARAIADPCHRSTRLTEALVLWRGSPLADVASPDLRTRLCATYDELHLTARELRIEAELQCGRAPEEVLVELADLCAAHPGRERLVASKMIALYRSGRQAEAITAYQTTAAALADEFGIDPDADLQEVYLKILRRDPELDDPATSVPQQRVDFEQAGNPVEPRPHQLPTDIDVLVGREAFLSYGAAVLTPSPNHRSPAMLAIHGGAGVGKSAVGVRLANLVSGHYPDGQLYVRLTDVNGGGLETPAALDQLLRALDVPAERVPEGLDERAALFRTTTADKQLVIMFDDAQSVAQLRPLLPSSARCGIIATSRRPLIGLEIADHCHLEPLADDASLQLLTRLSGVAGSRATISDLIRILELCGGLPLALRIVAARLSIAGPGSLHAVRRQLQDEVNRLDVLRAGDLAVEASLALSIVSAGVESRVLLRRLVALNLAQFSSWIAGPLLECTEDHGAEVLDELRSLELIHVFTDQPWSRFGIHPLVRSFVVRRADDARHSISDDAAGANFVRATLRLAGLADDNVGHGFVQTLCLPEVDCDSPPIAEATARADGRVWFEVESATVASAVTVAGRIGLGRLAAQLALRLSNYLTVRDCGDVASAVLESAREALDGYDAPDLHARLLQASFRSTRPARTSVGAVGRFGARIP